MNRRHPILVFGPTGQQGGAVARTLLDAGWPVRAIVRDRAGSKASSLRSAGAQIVEGSFENVDALRSAMRSVHWIFSVLPGNLTEAEEVRLGCLIADLALESEVEHFVYSSGASVGDRPTGVPRFDAKWQIEAHVRELPLTQPSSDQ